MIRQPFSEPLDDALPTEAINKGYGLTWWSPVAFSRDPVFLYKQKKEIYRWDYIPSLTEVWEKIQELEAGNDLLGGVSQRAGETTYRRG